MKIFRIILKPDKYVEKLLFDNRSGWYYFFIFGFTFAVIGPILSFYSLISQLEYSMNRALLYSLTTYFMDLLTVIIFSFFISVLSGKNFEKILKSYVIVNIPIWICDVFDIYQPLRVLSNIGFLYSFFLLWVVINIQQLRRYAVFVILLHLILYILNALVSELIATNPLILNILRSI